MWLLLCLTSCSPSHSHISKAASQYIFSKYAGAITKNNEPLLRVSPALSIGPLVVTTPTPCSNNDHSTLHSPPVVSLPIDARDLSSLCSSLCTMTPLKVLSNDRKSWDACWYEDKATNSSDVLSESFKIYLFMISGMEICGNPLRGRKSHFWTPEVRGANLELARTQEPGKYLRVHWLQSPELPRVIEQD